MVLRRLALLLVLPSVATLRLPLLPPYRSHQLRLHLPNRHTEPPHRPTPTSSSDPLHLRRILTATLASICLTCGSFALLTRYPSSAQASTTADKASVVRDIFKWKNGPKTPIDAVNIMKNRFEEVRSGVTGRKISELRVGESLVARLRDIEKELDATERDT